MSLDAGGFGIAEQQMRQSEFTLCRHVSRRRGRALSSCQSGTASSNTIRGMMTLQHRSEVLTPLWVERMVPGCWYQISGERPDLGLSPTPAGTCYLADNDPAKDEKLNPP